MIQTVSTAKKRKPELLPRLSRPRAERMADAFKALADPTRLRLVHTIMNGERCVHEICEELGLEQSAVSHQLRLLRTQRIVAGRREGRHVFYSLDDEHIRGLFDIALAHVSHTEGDAG